ncbi:hypothetical protein LF599_18105 [Pseudodesulfovibrio thermohalotolerans]|uniref:hypothetical protein n=1 Tax=Pseudodesulfovibrio thermohalotolerans TaxID=2880651 RepID=UPI002441007F|nr:hypothetical protein [Pseudodesulfovibrio thermohalotolerans]WFS62544.1 hypothetical protein LF599_18105 [Pseudodesulfovibrio thermohalotolerans]
MFRMLPAYSGDACLLTTRRGTYLFDGGILCGDLSRMLRERRVGKLRVAVCTSASPERLGGILDLMESGYPVGEYWLPDSLRVLAAAARDFDGGFPDWLVRCGWPVPVEASFPMPNTMPPVQEGHPLTACAELALLGTAACTGRLPVEPRPLAPAETFPAVSRMLLSSLAETGNGGLLQLCLDALGRDEKRNLPASAVLCGRLLANRAEALPPSTHRVARQVGMTFALAVMAEGLLARGGIRVRWFRQTGRLEEHLVPRHPVMCLNGVEAADRGAEPRRMSAASLLQAARRISVPGAGLVFRYGDADCGVLVCGNSRLSFLGRRGVLPLARPTVITAPQLGSPGGEGAYGRVRSADPGADAWVRAKCFRSRRVAEGFMRQAVRYCLCNCRDRTLQEILLVFDRGRWRRLAGGVCTCL